jgi:hypothetical protein
MWQTNIVWLHLENLVCCVILRKFPSHVSVLCVIWHKQLVVTALAYFDPKKYVLYSLKH